MNPIDWKLSQYLLSTGGWNEWYSNTFFHRYFEHIDWKKDSRIIPRCYGSVNLEEKFYVSIWSVAKRQTKMIDDEDLSSTTNAFRYQSDSQHLFIWLLVICVNWEDSKNKIHSCDKQNERFDENVEQKKIDESWLPFFFSPSCSLSLSSFHHSRSQYHWIFLLLTFRKINESVWIRFGWRNNLIIFADMSLIRFSDAHYFDKLEMVFLMTWSRECWIQISESSNI